MFFFRRSATCALTVTAVTLSCGVAARAQVGVVQRAPLAPVGVAPVGAVVGVVTAPVMGAVPVGAVGGVKASGVNTGLLLLLGQIADGQMTLNEAWDKGLLDAPKVLQLLSQSQRLTEDTRNETLQRDLAGLLVKLAPESVAVPEKLSARVRVALCRYYADNGDARAVPLCEALIAEKLEGKQVNQPLASNPDGGSSSLYLSSVILLAQYYEKVGQWQKAGETWERALTFWQDVDWFQAGVRIDAARVYTTLGQNDKAQQFYSQVAQYGNGWFSGLVLYDQANELILKGKHKEARQLLNTPVEGQDAEQSKIVLLALQATSHYQTGEVIAARRYAQQAIDQASAIKLTDGKGLKASVNVAEDILSWSTRWTETPIAIEPTELRMILPSPTSNGEYAARSIFVRTYRDVPLEVQIDNPQIKGRVAQKINETNYFVQKEVVLDIAPGALRQNVDATLIVTSPQHPEYKARIPIHIEVQKPIQLSSSVVFFGQLQKGVMATQTLTLSAFVPFRVVEVKSDSPFLDVEVRENEATQKQRIELTLTPSPAQQFYSGTIRIQTSVLTQQFIEVPYAAQSG